MVYFIVEGQTDKALIKNILISKKENEDFKFLGLKGDGSVLKTLENLTEHEISQNLYFVIVDADKSFSDRNKQMVTLTQGKGIEFYIFPNHKDNGDLETLLLSNIDKDNKTIKCFDSYQDCLGINVENKAKLYAYTTIELNQKPEEYIKTFNFENDFKELKQKLTNLFN